MTPESVRLAEAIRDAIRDQATETHIYIEPTDYLDHVTIDGALDFEAIANKLIDAGYRQGRAE